MRRPQKPFTVEVKRGRKGPAAKFLGAEAPKADAPMPIKSAAPNPPPAAFQPRPEPPRRILETIAPPPVAALAPDEVVAGAPKVRGRKRTNGKAHGEPVLASREAEKRPRPKPVRLEAPRVAGASERKQASVPRPFIFAAPLAAPVLRAAHDERAEAADALPRGERWKRRLPKVLW